MTITAVHVLATPDEEREADVAGSAPVDHQRDLAGMYTSFLKQPGGLEVQLVSHD